MTNIFGCDFRSGRSEAAPLLRKREVPTHIEEDTAAAAAAKDFEDMNGDDVDCGLFDNYFRDALMHDADVLPHLYSDADIEYLFPNIAPADAVANLEDWVPEIGEYDEAVFGYRQRPSGAAASCGVSRGGASSSARDDHRVASAVGESTTKVVHIPPVPLPGEAQRVRGGEAPRGSRPTPRAP